MIKNNKQFNIFFSNTLMLYLLTFVNQFFGILTIPYLTRVLGPEMFGVIGFCLSIMIYFQLLIDYGFILTATADIARNRDNIKKVSEIATAVSSCKVLLVILSLFILIVACNINAYLYQIKGILLIFFLNTVFTSLLPDFLYRGMEEMKPITFRTAFIKCSFTLLVFVLVKQDSDYIFIPWIYLAGSIFAFVISVIDVYKRFNVKLVNTQIENITSCFRYSFPFFVSRIASTIYGASNLFILGLKMPGAAEIGYYSCNDKILAISRTASSPIADSLYPHLVATGNVNLAKKIIFCISPILIICGILGFIYSYDICILAFGEEYGNASESLRALIPVMVFTPLTYIMGFPVLSALHLEKHANYSVILGAFIHIFQLIFLEITGCLNLVNVCIATSITEGIVLVYRIAVVVFRNRILKNF